MPADSPPVAVPAPDIPESAASTPPSLIALFVAFAKMSLAGVGGVLVRARRGIVDQHQWTSCWLPIGPGQAPWPPPLAFATRLNSLWLLLAGGTAWVLLALSNENR